MTNSSKNLGRPRQKDIAIPTKERVLKTAIALFVEQGYKNASMDEVAARCGVTKATVYYYYKTKADLFTAAIESLMRIIRHNSVAILSSDAPFKERLHKLVVTFAYATLNVDVNNFIREATSSLSPEQLAIIQQSEQAMHQAIEQCFFVESEKGNLPKDNVKFITHLFLTLLNLSQYRDLNNVGFFPTPEQTADEIVNFFLNGIFK